MNAIESVEDAARFVLQACPELRFEQPLHPGHPAWQYQKADGPDAFFRACEDHLRNDRFSPVERWVTSGETRRLVREAAEHLVTTYDRNSL